MSLLRRDDFFKSSFDDPFFENWDSDLKDFRHGFFKNSLLAASPAVANSTVDQVGIMNMDSLKSHYWQPCRLWQIQLWLR